MIFLLIIRQCMVVRREDVTTVYADRWPKQMDLLELIYKPLVLVLIPSIAGFVCRCMDRMRDGFVLLMQRNVYQPLRSRRKAEAGFRTAFVAGMICNAAVGCMNRTIYRKHPLKCDYIDVFTERERMLKQANRMVTASASFSLLMFGIGLVIMVVYLLWHGNV